MTADPDLFSSISSGGPSSGSLEGGAGPGHAAAPASSALGLAAAKFPKPDQVAGMGTAMLIEALKKCVAALRC